MDTPLELLSQDCLPQINNPTPELLNSILQVMRSQNWTDTFNSITALRSIVRFYPQVGPATVHQFATYLYQQLHNGRSLIVKNTLILIKETFMLGRQFSTEDCVKDFVPYLIKKASTEVGHLKTLASEAMTEFVRNCGYDISFVLICQWCFDKNPAITQMSTNVLAKLLQNVGRSIVQLAPETLKIIMTCLSRQLDGKRPNVKSWANEICMFIFNTLGTDHFVQLMNFALTQEDVNKMMSSMNEKATTQTKTRENLSTRRKTMVRHDIQERNKENALENYNLIIN